MLTAKQEKFVNNIIAGMSQSDAYRDAYSTKRMTDKSIWDASSKLASHPEVSKRILELRAKISKKNVMSAQDRMEWLTGVLKDPDVDINTKLKASDQLNRMQGEYVQKVEAEVKKETIINIELVDE